MQEGLAPRSQNGVGLGDETGGTGDLIFAPYFNGRKENIEWKRDKS